VAVVNEEHRSLIEWLDSWRIAAGVAFIAITILALWSFKLWVDLNEVLEDRVEAEQAADRESVRRCFSSAAQGPAIRRVLIALENDLTSDEGKEALRDFRRISALNSPTILECRRLADQLNVPISQGVPGG
jgi:hypothetical protein